MAAESSSATTTTTTPPSFFPSAAEYFEDMMAITPTTSPLFIPPAAARSFQEMETSFAKLTTQVATRSAAAAAAAGVESFPSATHRASNQRNKNGHQNPHQQPWRVEEDAVTAVDNCAADEEDTTSIDRSASSFLTNHNQTRMAPVVTATATATVAMECAERTPEAQHPRRPRPQNFTVEETARLNQVLYEDHPDEDLIFVPHTDETIRRGLMQTLRHRVWLKNDPVNIFFQVVLTHRDQQLCKFFVSNYSVLWQIETFISKLLTSLTMLCQ